jgi:uncharacterized repeat protein (TIGR03803 family)
MQCKFKYLRLAAFYSWFFSWAFSLRVLGQGIGFTNLYNFVYTNGTGPVASLLSSGGVLYGPTRMGGENGFNSGYGSVFKLNPDGSGFATVRVFTNGPDGGNLQGSLALAGNTLYGPALFGGASNYGTLFGLSTDGTQLTNLFSFPATSASFPYTNSYGAYPQSGLVISGNVVYGTATSGGMSGFGTLFAVATDGTSFTNLHNFAVSDGQSPSAPLLLSAGMLYGMTPDGGANAAGTIFKVSISGTGFTNLYSFTYDGGYPYTNADGARPLGSLVLSGNTLYGAASSGGSNASGTIFKINTDGSGFATLHTFSGLGGSLQTNDDGANPQSELLLFNDALYGTAMNGGQFGNGTLFRLNLDGSGFTTLYQFTATNNSAGTNADGAHPVAGLTQSGSVLYGTSSAGGAAGFGTVFSLLVPPSLFIAQVGTNVILTWPTNVSGCSLQSTTNLAPPVTWSVLSGQYAVTIPRTNKQEFFRLANFQFGPHIVTWIHDGFTSAGAGQHDVWFTNASNSYGSYDSGPGPFVGDSSAAFMPVTNSASLSDPLLDFTTWYYGTNISFLSGANAAGSQFYYYEVDGLNDGNYPWIRDTNTGAGRINVSFANAGWHTIRLRVEGKITGPFHLDGIRIQNQDSVKPTIESAHRVNIVGFGDSHTDGGSSNVGDDPVTQMQTWIGRIHSFLPVQANVFGSGIGGTGVVNWGLYGGGGTYTNRIYEDIWGQGLNPDILIYEGSNDHALITFGDGTNLTSAQYTNLYAIGISNICRCIGTNMTANNVWMVCGPALSGSGQMDAGWIWQRDNMKTNCNYWGFHFIDFLGGATNQNDINKGYITDANYSTMWGPGGHLTPYGKQWFAGLLATNIVTNLLNINK